MRAVVEWECVLPRVNRARHFSPKLRCPHGRLQAISWVRGPRVVGRRTSRDIQR